MFEDVARRFAINLFHAKRNSFTLVLGCFAAEQRDEMFGEGNSVNRCPLSVIVYLVT